MAEVMLTSTQQPIMQVMPNPSAGIPLSPDDSSPSSPSESSGKWWVLVLVLVLLFVGFLTWYLVW